MKVSLRLGSKGGGGVCAQHSLCCPQHDGQPYCHKPCYGILFGPKGEYSGGRGHGDLFPSLDPCLFLLIHPSHFSSQE